MKHFDKICLHAPIAAVMGFITYFLPWFFIVANFAFFGKEYFDTKKKTPTGFSWGDILADYIGYILGYLIAYLIFR